MKKLKIIGISIVTLITLVIFYAVFIEKYVLVTEVHPIYFDNLPEQFNGYRILVVSDIHYRTRLHESWLKKIIERANTADCDVIVGVGDYVQTKHDEQEIVSVWKYLNELEAKDGVFLILGNHDIKVNRRLSLQYLAASGKSLRHRNTLITRDGATLALAGVGYFWNDVLGDKKALAGIPNDAFTVLLAHSPDTADLPHKYAIDLYVSAHSHGGQVRIPFTNWTPILPLLNRKYNYGVRENRKGQKVFISRGVGWGILPLRFNCYPELAVIELCRK